MAEVSDWEQLAVSLANMARDLLAQDSVQLTLDRIAAHAVELVDGCEAAGIMMVRGGRVHALAASDNVAHASDRIQGELREGPCFDAANEGQQIYRVTDMTATEHRWPRYAPKAREPGVGSMMGFLLFTDGDQQLGALDLYSSRPEVFTERSEQAGWLLAPHAAVTLSTARHSAQLNEAITSRQDIGEALGILMERHKLTEHDAFDMLRNVSQQRNIKVRDLAQAINTTGTFPEAD